MNLPNLNEGFLRKAALKIVNTAAATTPLAAAIEFTEADSQLFDIVWPPAVAKSDQIAEQIDELGTHLVQIETRLSATEAALRKQWQDTLTAINNALLASELRGVEAEMSGVLATLRVNKAAWKNTKPTYDELLGRHQALSDGIGRLFALSELLAGTKLESGHFQVIARAVAVGTLTFALYDDLLAVWNRSAVYTDNGASANVETHRLVEAHFWDSQALLEAELSRYQQVLGEMCARLTDARLALIGPLRNREQDGQGNVMGSFVEDMYEYWFTDKGLQPGDPSPRSLITRLGYKAEARNNFVDSRVTNVDAKINSMLPDPNYPAFKGTDVRQLFYWQVESEAKGMASQGAQSQKATNTSWRERYCGLVRGETAAALQVAALDSATLFTTMLSTWKLRCVHRSPLSGQEAGWIRTSLGTFRLVRSAGLHQREWHSPFAGTWKDSTQPPSQDRLQITDGQGVYEVRLPEKELWLVSTNPVQKVGQVLEGDRYRPDGRTVALLWFRDDATGRRRECRQVRGSPNTWIVDCDLLYTEESRDDWTVYLRSRADKREQLQLNLHRRAIFRRIDGAEAQQLGTITHCTDWQDTTSWLSTLRGKAIQLQSATGEVLALRAGATAPTLEALSNTTAKERGWRVDEWETPNPQAAFGIRLRSLQNDKYLHRPEGTAPLTTYSTGVGNQWSFVRPRGRAGLLVSWKSDALAPDGKGRGVTTHPALATPPDGDFWTITEQ